MVLAVTVGGLWSAACEKRERNFPLFTSLGTLHKIKYGEGIEKKNKNTVYTIFLFSILLNMYLFKKAHFVARKTSKNYTYQIL